MRATSSVRARPGAAFSGASFERRKEHELGAQKPDAVHVLRRDTLGEIGLAEIHVDAGRRDVGAGDDVAAEHDRRTAVPPRRQSRGPSEARHGRAPAITVPARASTVTIIPSCSSDVAGRAPTMHGMPSSRDTIAACEVMPPASVTIAAARRMIGTQSGEVMVVTKPPRLQLPLVGRGEHAHAPVAYPDSRPGRGAVRARLVGTVRPSR